jgi:hypothetical protein
MMTDTYSTDKAEPGYWVVGTGSGPWGPYATAAEAERTRRDWLSTYAVPAGAVMSDMVRVIRLTEVRPGTADQLGRHWPSRDRLQAGLGDSLIEVGCTVWVVTDRCAFEAEVLADQSVDGGTYLVRNLATGEQSDESVADVTWKHS